VSLSFFIKRYGAAIRGLKTLGLVPLQNNVVMGYRSLKQGIRIICLHHAVFGC